MLIKALFIRVKCQPISYSQLSASNWRYLNVSMRNNFGLNKNGLRGHTILQEPCKVWTFWEAHIIWKKSSSWFWHLISKSADLSKPWGRFFQIMCVSQKVLTLMTQGINKLPKSKYMQNFPTYLIFFQGPKTIGEYISSYQNEEKIRKSTKID